MKVMVKDGKTLNVKTFDVKEEEIDDYTTVLELLLKLREERDPSLVLRYSCRMALCGSCGMVINGKPRLACLTKVKSLGEKMMVEPLRNLATIRGLVPDLIPFFQKYRSVTPHLIGDEEQERPTRAYTQTDDQVKRYLQFNYCIQCGLCYSACPIVATNEKFPGPAAINVAYRYSADSRDRNPQRILKLDTPEGVWSCRVAGSCSFVCPKGVDPSLAIQLVKSSLLRGGKP
ncbi:MULTISPECIES: succinate dehydrogenase/fumarate reductase iron-sulfur subunit [Metallosphaera]|uniref:succinate dehydrogenase/fumarate reductase iron-sulfur subunit n=1 Tax=Metallosphaera TaxID=41980 RepID=UPI001F0690CC|nr:succinate dehydrogenase iron-sulfur subunit [Metallosphaera sedula]MCH1772167.1 succinate dehydrogenase iron-sulfur subunit [Metallosphaera sedula]MCP6727713.1 succinate dehydrogenase iron-sulfur subunit [Metallosphaera sedula]